MTSLSTSNWTDTLRALARSYGAALIAQCEIARIQPAAWLRAPADYEGADGSTTRAPTFCAGWWRGLADAAGADADLYWLTVAPQLGLRAELEGEALEEVP